MFALVDCARYNEDFIKSRFDIRFTETVHFTVILVKL